MRFPRPRSLFGKIDVRYPTFAPETCQVSTQKELFRDPLWQS